MRTTLMNRALTYLGDGVLHSGPMSEIAVVVADAQRLFCEVLAAALAEHEPLTVPEQRPQSARALLDAVEADQPDVAVVDFYLDIAAPEELLRAIAARAPQAKTIFLSWQHSPEDIHRVLGAGAVGYLPKSCEIDLVAEAVQRAHTGESPVFGEQLDHLLDDLEQRRRTAQELDERLAELSHRELEVLARLAAGYTREGVAEQLGIRPDTVRTHMMNIKSKTGARTQLEAVRMAEGKAAAWLPNRLPR